MKWKFREPMLNKKNWWVFVLKFIKILLVIVLAPVIFIATLVAAIIADERSPRRRR